MATSLSVQLPNTVSHASPHHRRPSEKADYYPWFDWLRLLLAMVVLFYHDGLIPAHSDTGNFAVQVFFALSGWLIGGILLDLPKHELPRFYLNRALRIWCPYFLALTLLVSVSLVYDSVGRKWAEFVFYKATFVYNLFGPRQLWNHLQQMPLHATGNHFWSVNAEEQFYLLAPLLLVLAPARLGRRVVVWVVLAFAAYVTGNYASIALGVLAAVIVKNHGPVHTQGWFRTLAAIVFTVTLYGLFATRNYNLLAPICAVSLVLLLAITGKRHRWGELAGGMSYPLYLNAWSAAFFVNAMCRRFQINNGFAHHALTITLSLVFAAFLYLFFDRQILARRRQLYTPARARTVMIFAYAIATLGLCVGVFLIDRNG